MNQLPFSVYDFFGCLASGAVVLAGITVSFIGYPPLRESPSLPVGIVLVIAAYVIGHIVANIAGYLIEGRLVAGRLGRPPRSCSARPSSHQGRRGSCPVTARPCRRRRAGGSGRGPGTSARMRCSTTASP